MAIYRQIQTQFWQDDFILSLEKDEKLFYQWLLTNPKVNQCGCYKIVKQIAELELHMEWAEIEDLLNKFIDFKKIKFDSKTYEVLLLNWYKYNASNSPKVINNVRVCIQEVINIEFKRYCTDTLLRGANVEKIQYGYSMDTTPIVDKYPIAIKEEDEEEIVRNNISSARAREKKVQVFFEHFQNDFWSSDFVIDGDKEKIKEVIEFVCDCLTDGEIRSLNLEIFQKLQSFWYAAKTADNPQRYFRKCFDEMKNKEVCA